MYLTLLILCLLSIHQTLSFNSADQTWPIRSKPYPSRPADGAPYCQAGVIPFCPTGLKPHYMPLVAPTDELYVYAMKAPVWEFKFGSLMEKFKVMHDAIGFHHVQSGLNLTMEWYELFQLFNCTFPHEKGENITWCNQGATCIYPGIDAKHWKENGTLVQVTTINGTVFNQFANWTLQDNNTYPIYETWTVRERLGNNTVWFEAFDCASWVIRAFEAMHNYGAEFDTSVQLNYTKVELITATPRYVGNSSNIHENEEVYGNLLKFYANFQHYKNPAKMFGDLIKFMEEFLVDDGKFFLFYNENYYELPLQYPFIRFTFDEVPLPGSE